jgi:histidinol-phosphatase (PHP family)
MNPTPQPVRLTTNYHTHSRFCDGHGEIEDYVRQAIALGFTSIGISSHAPVPFPNTYAIRADQLTVYCAEVRRLQAVYAGQIEIALGAEVDVIPGLQPYFTKTLLPEQFDYCIGSVHFIGNDPHTATPWDFDGNAAEFERGLNDWYEGDFRRLAEDFYALERQVPAFLPTIAIVGHMDRIKKYNLGERYFRESDGWYRDLVEATLRTYAEVGVIVELNTAGWRQPHGSAYPSPWITVRCAALGIRMTIDTDAHQPSQMNADHDRAIAQLHASGYEEIWVRRGGAWVAEGLPT